MNNVAREDNYSVGELHDQIDNLSFLLRRIDGEVAEVKKSKYIESASE
jgi:hypothetical protein